MDFFHTTVTPRAIELAVETLNSGFLSEGKRVAELEQELSKRLRLSFPVTTNSGTSALEVALKTLQVRKGDEIITSAQSFVATSLSILAVGAVPVFADINPRTGNISPESVKAKITDKTIGILPVHYAGMPCELETICGIANNYQLFVMDDAAQALGATYRGQPIGNGQTEATCFSLQATKGLTSGDGGIICFQNSFFADLAKKYRWFGIDRERDLPDELGERQYTLTNIIGGKYHLNDAAASIALGNLDGFRERLARRQQIAKRYNESLKNVSGLELLDDPLDRTSSYYLFPILLDNSKSRLAFVSKLKENGIPAHRVHARIDRHPLFGGIQKELVGQAEFDERHVCIPIHDGLNDADVELIISTIKDGW